MKTSTLDRAPRPLPADIRTGDPQVDGYLAQVNLYLTGSRAVRRHTLREARDFLTDAGTGAGDRHAAIRSAMDEFGSPEEIGKAQRRERHAMFFRTALTTGPMFAVLMLIFALLQSGPSAWQWKMLIAMFLFNMTFFGLAMGATFAYCMGKPAPSAAPQDTAAAVGGFEVVYRRSSRTLCWILLCAFVPMQAVLVLGLFGLSPFGILDSGIWSWPVIAFLLLVNIKNIGAPIHALLFRARTGPDTLLVHRLGGTLDLHRSQVVGISKPGRFRQFFSTMYGSQCRVAWRAGDGRVHGLRLSLTPDVTNGDRLLSWLESAAHGNALANESCVAGTAQNLRRE